MIIYCKLFAQKTIFMDLGHYLSNKISIILLSNRRICIVGYVNNNTHYSEQYNQRGTMRPGSEKIFQCLKCSEHISFNSYFSMNTFGATMWTDGKIEGPMIQCVPKLIKCPHCQEALWLDEQPILDSIPFGDKISYVNIKSYKTPDLKDYYSKLFNANISPKKELYLRIRILHRENDKRRYEGTEKDSSENIIIPNPKNNIGKCTTKEKLSRKEVENMIGLLEILNISNDAELIIMAEIKRNLGMFEDAKVLLDKDFESVYAKKVFILKN